MADETEPPGGDRDRARRSARLRRMRERRKQDRREAGRGVGMDTDVVLIVCAAIGAALYVGADPASLSDLDSRQSRGVVLAVFLTAAVYLALRFVLPRAWGAIREHPRILVPLGLAAGGSTVLAWASGWSVLAAFLIPSTQIWFLNLSMLFIAQILIWAFFGSWTTVLVLDVARGRPCDPAGQIRTAWGWFPRVVGIESICWIALLACLSGAILVAPVAIQLALLLIGTISVGLNVCTAAILPVALSEDRGFIAAFRAGVRASIDGWRRWWKPLAVQLLLLGLITFFAVAFSDGPNHTSRTNWAVNGFWIGGYESECRWYSKYMEALDTSAVDAIAGVLGLVFGVLAIAVKLQITMLLSDGDAEVPESVGDPADDSTPARQRTPRRPGRSSTGAALRRARARRRRRRRGSP